MELDDPSRSFRVCRGPVGTGLHLRGRLHYCADLRRARQGARGARCSRRSWVLARYATDGPQPRTVWPCGLRHLRHQRCLVGSQAKILGQPLAGLLGHQRESVAICSGGFTTYSDEQLRDQLSGWIKRDGCQFVKMKIGSEPARDPHRVAVARAAAGDCQRDCHVNLASAERESKGSALVQAAVAARQF